MLKKLATSMGALTLMAGMAMAQTAEGPWTFDEMLVVYPDLTAETFAEIDADGDGMVTQAELDDAIEAGVVEATEG